MRVLIGLAFLAGLAAFPAAAHAGSAIGAELSTEGYVIQVRDGCGRGWHENRRGYCVPNRAVRKHLRHHRRNVYRHGFVYPRYVYPYHHPHRVYRHHRRPGFVLQFNF